MPVLSCPECAGKHSLESWLQLCPGCGLPLEVRYPDLAPGAARVRRSSVLMERYREFLPLAAPDLSLDLGEGGTPLVASLRLGERLGLGRLLFKLEGANPTHSFKDRGSAVGVQRALALGVRGVGTLSTGNMAGSVAAYGKRAGLAAYVLVRADTPRERILPVAIYAPTLIAVEGDYRAAYDRTLELGPELGIYFINADDPFRVEGQKTLAFEILEGLDLEPPDFIVLPVSAGGNTLALLKGLEEFRRAGLIERIPQVVAVQAAVCAPIAAAFAAGADRIEPFPSPRTLAHSISNPYPKSGNRVLRRIRENGGMVVSVSDQEIVRAQHALASTEAIFAQPASAAPYAAIEALVRAGTLTSEHTVVAVVTGSGLKDLTVVERNLALSPIPATVEALAGALA